MPEDCPFQFYIDAKKRFCWAFLVGAILIALVGLGIGGYAFMEIGSMHEDRLKILFKVSSVCITGTAVWLFNQCYQHFKPVNFLSSVCGRLTALKRQPAGDPDRDSQIQKLTENGWAICNEP